MTILLLLVLLSVFGNSGATNTCTYNNQDTDGVTVTKNSQIVAPSAASSLVIDEGDSIELSCVDPVNTAFEYNTPTTYTCPQGGAQAVIDLPICVDKCQKAKELSDENTTFVDENGADVSADTLPQNTPITIVCHGDYAQKFAQAVTQSCDAWTDDAICKKMCALSEYDSGTTKLDSNGLTADNKFLRVGYNVKVSCWDSDASLPEGAGSSFSCTESEDIQIPSCGALCNVPQSPDNTQYHATQDKLAEGQSFTITCNDPLMKLEYGASNTVECQAGGLFGDIPECKSTCGLTAYDSTSTKLSKDVSSVLAQGESVEVSCVNSATDLLPYRYDTPYTMTCSDPTTDFTIPLCQSTCAMPAVPAFSSIEVQGSQPLAGRLSLEQPVSMTCDASYSFMSPQGTTSKQFTCKDGQTEAAVVIDEYCYVFAELAHESTGTNMLKLRGEVSNADADLTDITVTLELSDGQVHDTTPNSDVTVTLNQYGPVTVKVKTGSSADANQEIIRYYNNVYPGPPSPLIQPSKSTSTSVTIDIIKPDILDTQTFNDNLVEYIVTYNNGEVKGKNSSYVLEGLSPASEYVIQSQTVLTENYGGASTPESFTVYTGPNSVSGVNCLVREKEVNITWEAVDSADIYMVTMRDLNGNEHTTKTQINTDAEFTKLSPGDFYNLEIKAGRKVDGTLYYGDVFTQQIQSGPEQPDRDLFAVTTAGQSVTIARADNLTRKKRATSPEYVIFLNGEQNSNRLTSDSDSVTIDLELARTYDISVAEAVNDGYGSWTWLKQVQTADCYFIQCVNCKNETLFSYVRAGTDLVVQCVEENHTITYNEEEVKELKLTCDDKNQYVMTEIQSQIFTPRDILCTQSDKVIGNESNNTIYYIIGGIIVFLVLIVIIIIFIMRKRRTQGSYNAKKVKETTNKGSKSPDGGTGGSGVFVDDSAYFENKWDKDMLAERPQSRRSKATSYGSQELRMEIADSDSGITEDLENTFFNPALYSSHYQDDTVSTKSALV